MEAHAATAAPVTAARSAPSTMTATPAQVPELIGAGPASAATALTYGMEHGSRARFVQVLQRSVGNAAVASLLTRSAAPTIQRAEENEKPLADIQGRAMYDLLPSLAALTPAQRTDEQAAAKVGGPRLVLAQRAVRSKGNWQAFATANTAEMVALPLDQVEDLMRFIGAPTDVKTYQRSDFDSRFDALVDPSTGQITLIIRVKVEQIDSNSYSGSPVGSKEWSADNGAAFEAFKPRFKTAVEAAWAGTGAVKAVKPIVKSLKQPKFATKVTVQMVESGEHVAFRVYGMTSGASGEVELKLQPGETSRKGTIHMGDIDKQKKSLSHPQRDRSLTTVTSEQVVAAHEIGHAMGLHHVACEGNQAICYGTTQSEYQDILGGGSSLGPTTVSAGPGKAAGVHDNLAPFERIGERWSKDVFPGSLAAKLGGWGPA